MSIRHYANHANSANPEQRPDAILAEIADYVAGYTPNRDEAYDTARLCLIDSLGCAMLALRYPECTKLLGPVVPGATLPNGARVPGTAFSLDPVRAAFNLGAMIRWLDYNDTWLAAEWGHPSDNLGGILAVADYRSRVRQARGEPPLMMRDVLTATIKAYEIQGVLALANSFNRVGLDHVLLVRVASAAVAADLLGGDRETIFNAVSNAWLDGGALRAYRHAPNAGTRKSWAAGDATARGVWHALLALRGEMGYPTALSTPTWGFHDVLFQGNPVTLARPLGSYVIEHILFKIAFPAEFHAQTAVEAAFALHPQIAGRLDHIVRVEIETHEAALRIISKTGTLHNPADRDHCLQYMVAVALIRGNLTADDYEDATAADPRIDALREKMVVTENAHFSADYLDPALRSVANTVRVVFADGSATQPVTVEYPLGHRRRRAEGVPLLDAKFAANLATHFPPERVATIRAVCAEGKRLATMPVPAFLDLFTVVDDARSRGA